MAKKCELCEKFYGDGGPCDEGKPECSVHRKNQVGRGGKKGNNYAGLIPSRIYRDCPKTVLAAIAMSFFVNHDQGDDNATTPIQGFVKEWMTLHEQGIVPQKPTRDALALLGGAK